jgi:hypothetical protein
VDIAKLIPMAIVMIAGPQILSAIFLATTERWKMNSLAFVAGAALSISIVVAGAYLIGGGNSEDGGPDSNTIYIVIIVLLVYAAIHTFRNRKESEPPKWMGKLQDARPRLSFTLGFLLLGIFPTDIITSVAVGGTLAGRGDPFWYYLPFLGLTLFFLALPALTVFALGERGQRLLPKARDWMNNNSWIVSEFVIILFIVLTAGNLE